MANDHYDVIVIGSGPGGGALAQSLAPSGKRILMLERGGYLPRSRDNWDAKTVFVEGAYQAPDTWYGKDGSSFHPGLHYYVGGNSKVYGSALFRLLADWIRAATEQLAGHTGSEQIRDSNGEQ